MPNVEPLYVGLCVTDDGRLFGKSGNGESALEVIEKYAEADSYYRLKTIWKFCVDGGVVTMRQVWIAESDSPVIVQK